MVESSSSSSCGWPSVLTPCNSSPKSLSTSAQILSSAISSSLSLPVVVTLAAFSSSVVDASAAVVADDVAVLSLFSSVLSFFASGLSFAEINQFYCSCFKNCLWMIYFH